MRDVLILVGVIAVGIIVLVVCRKGMGYIDSPGPSCPYLCAYGMCKASSLDPGSYGCWNVDQHNQGKCCCMDCE